MKNFMTERSETIAQKESSNSETKSEFQTAASSGIPNMIMELTKKAKLIFDINVTLIKTINN